MTAPDEVRRQPARPVTRAVAVALAVAVAVAGLVVWLSRPGDREQAPAAAGPTRSVEPSTPAAAPSTPVVAPSTPVMAPSTAEAAPVALKPPPPCDRPKHHFRPRTITVAGVTRNATVLAPPREPDGVPGVPPLTTAGKALFAWDRAQGTRPGDLAGNVLLNAHTWPDGSALGNHLLAGLQRGDRIVVHGTAARLCYRVSERVEVPASRGLARYYATDGPPQLAIVVCSGRRLGPGVWEKRTIWFARPAA